MENIPEDSFFRASSAVIDVANGLFRLDLRTVVRAALQILIKDQPALAVIKHVNHDHCIAALRERSGKTRAVIILLTIGGEHRVFVFGFNQLFLAPIIKASVVMQRNDRRDGELGAFGNEEIAGHFHIRSRPELQPLAHVVAFIHALEDLWSRVCGLWPVGHELKDFGARFRLPGFEILRPAMKKSKALARLFLLLLDKWIEISKRRALPALAFVGRRSRLRWRKEV